MECDWEDEHVQTVRFMRKSKLEAQRFGLKREWDELESQLIAKEQEALKEVRGVSNQCGKLRLEVESLEMELSNIKESKRRQILEIAHENRKELLDLENGISECADELTQIRREITELTMPTSIHPDTQVEREIDATIESLNREIDDTNRRLFSSDRILAERSQETRMIVESMMSELREIQSKEPELTRNLASETERADRLQKKLERAETSNAKMRETVQNLIQSRKQFREQAITDDDAAWKARLQSLTNLPK